MRTSLKCERLYQLVVGLKIKTLKDTSLELGYISSFLPYFAIISFLYWQLHCPLKILLLSFLTLINVCMSLPDEVVSTVGEGAFGKVVECIDKEK